MDILPPGRSPGCTADRSVPRRAFSWPARDRLGDRNPSSRYHQFPERKVLPCNRFLAHFSSGRDLSVAVLGSDLGNELCERRYLGWPPQFDVAIGSGFDLQGITFLQPGVLCYGLRYANSKAIAPLDHLHLHESSSFATVIRSIF